MKEPPLLTSSSSSRFDSTCDNPAAPRVFVVFDTMLAYPEYLITFSSDSGRPGDSPFAFSPPLVSPPPPSQVFGAGWTPIAQVLAEAASPPGAPPRRSPHARHTPPADRSLSAGRLDPPRRGPRAGGGGGGAASPGVREAGAAVGGVGGVAAAADPAEADGGRKRRGGEPAEPG
jgi:hypothetical protein